MAEIAQIQSIRALAIRATLLDDCGRPVNTTTTTKTQISTDGFISISFSPDIEEGNKVRKMTGNGKLCVVDNGICPQLVGMDLTLTLCAVPPHILELLTGAAQLVDANGNVKGVVASSYTDTVCPPHVMIEVWTDNVGKRCDETGRACRYNRYILPETFNWIISGDITLENDVYDLELKGYADINEYFQSPLGAADPDLTPGNVEALRTGPWGVICSNTLPEIVSDNWVNP